MSKCGQCEHHKKVKLSYGYEWCCCNPDSDYVGYETDYNDGCSEFTEKEDIKNDD